MSSSSSAASDATASADTTPAVSTGPSLITPELHITHPPLTGEIAHTCNELAKSLQEEESYKSSPLVAAAFVNQQNCYRYLRARGFDFAKAKKLMLESLIWRIAYRPDLITAQEVEPEAMTGKIRVLQEKDRHGRPIIVMDPSRENSKTHDSQMRHLVWQLERAKRKMGEGLKQHEEVDDKVGAAAAAATSSSSSSSLSSSSFPAPRIEKYTLFINHERSSIWNSPPMKTSLETMKILSDRYPENLGSAIIYKPGMLFAGVWAAIQPFLEARTKSKVTFIRGDVSEGSKNDLILKETIGPQWRELCDKQKDDYDHAKFWKEVVEEENEYLQKVKAQQQQQQQQQQSQESNTVAAEGTAASAASSSQ